MITTRQAYLKWGKAVSTILENARREPTDIERASLFPAFHGVIPEHTLKRKDGKPFTVGDYYDFTNKAWIAKQKSALIRLLMEVQNV